MTDNQREPEQTVFDFGDIYFTEEFKEQLTSEDENLALPGYLLTAAERKALSKVWQAAFTVGEAVAEGYLTRVSEGNIETAIREKLEDADLKPLLTSAIKKYTTSEWWSVLETTEYTADGERKSYDVLTSGSSGILSSFAEGDIEGIEDMDIPQRRKAFGLPETFLYVGRLDNVAITIAASMLGAVPKESPFFKVASSYEADPLRGITKRKIKAAADILPFIGKAGESIRDLTLAPGGDNAPVRLQFKGEDTLEVHGEALDSDYTDKLLMLVNYLILTSSDREYYFTLRLDYLAKVFGVTNLNKLWQKIVKAGYALLVTGLAQKNASGEDAKVNILQAFSPISKNGQARCIKIAPTPLYAAFVRNSEYFMYMPIKAFALRKNSYKMLRAFSTHHRMNIGNPNDNRLRVGTLLDVCNYQKPEELARASRTKQLIAMPFKRDLDKIVDEGVFSGYRVLKDGKELTEAEFTSPKIMNDYDTFARLVIAVEWSEEPPEYADLKDKREKAKAKRIEQGNAKPKHRKTTKPKG